uniref:Protein tyrosine phosphatase 4A2b n=1 Tax=Esox lucius TaxID=8010 RepID=A0AAY5K100_ESOLU
ASVETSARHSTSPLWTSESSAPLGTTLPRNPPEASTLGNPAFSQRSPGILRSPWTDCPALIPVPPIRKLPSSLLVPAFSPSSQSHTALLNGELKKFEVNTLVRVCDATYDKAPVEKEGIQVVDWPFDDGAPPPTQIVDDWLNLLKTKFRDEPGCCIAVHCVAGLGRAPVLVALALIETGMKYEDAVQFIRQKRRGAFNSKQLLYLEKYRPKMRLRFKDANGHNCCIQ